MAHYAYKSCIYSIPTDFCAEFEKSFYEEYGREFEPSGDYDGDYWHMAAAYIRFLQDKVEYLEHERNEKQAF
jgi:hypothetical protein